MTTHLEEYLNYYTKLRDPGFAVLVTGEWGTGKTHQVERCLPPNDRYYVSLFGLRSASEIHAALLAEVYPSRSKIKSFIRRQEDRISSVGGWITAGGHSMALVANAVLHKEIKIERTIVFDDLERSCLRVKELLGAINSYVEHHGARVVVIAHDEKLVDQFADSKEKIIGQRIKVEPELEQAFVAFRAKLSGEANRQFVGRNRAEIFRCFRESGATSLRTLRHVIEDVGRLRDVLDPDHLAHDGAMNELVNLFVALNVEVRNRKLGPGDLDQRLARQSPALKAANERHPAVELRSRLLQDEALIEMLIHGRYRRELVQQSIASSHHFIKPEDEPPWKVVIGFDSLPDDVVDRAAEEMDRQFRNREVTDSGEMLHIFALRMYMAEEGLLNQTVDEAEADCIKYIDDLLEAGSLPPREGGWMWYQPFETSHNGIQYWIAEKDRERFNRVFSHLIARRSLAMDRELPNRGSKLLELVRTDGQAFLSQVCANVDGENPYGGIPILANIAPEDFVEAWLGGRSANWRYISLALAGRHATGGADDALKKERPWLFRVIELMESEAAKTNSFRSVRIRRVIHPDLVALRDRETGKGPPNDTTNE